MRKRLYGLILSALMIFSVTGCSNEPKVSTEKVKGEVVSQEDIDPNGGADGVAGAYDHADSKYFVNPDFYNMKSDDQVTIISNFKTSQQTSEWSCGANAALVTLNHFDITDYTEWDIAVGMKAHTDEDVEGAVPGSANSWYEPGVNLKKMVTFLETVPGVKIVDTNYKAEYTEEDLVSQGDVDTLVYSPSMLGNFHKYFDSASLYSSDNDANTENWVSDAKDTYFVKWLTGHLKENRPIMVHTSEWNGHWATIIGYDNMGTETIGDDMLILADSYDTGDHWQDGYVVRPLEKFFYEWDDLNIASKPYQLQPFVVVDTAK